MTRIIATSKGVVIVILKSKLTRRILEKTLKIVAVTLIGEACKSKR